MWPEASRRPELEGAHECRCAWRRLRGGVLQREPGLEPKAGHSGNDSGWPKGGAARWGARARGDSKRSELEKNRLEGACAWRMSPLLTEGA